MLPDKVAHALLHFREGGTVPIEVVVQMGEHVVLQSVGTGRTGKEVQERRERLGVDFIEAGGRSGL